MQTGYPLTEQDLEQFKTRGYIKVRAFTSEDAAEMEEIVWRQMEKYGVKRDDPSTWLHVSMGGLSQAVRKTRLFREAITDEFTGAVDQLLGQGEWNRPKDWGTLLYTFPQVERDNWDVTSRQWHWHGNPLRNSGELRDLFVFSLLTPVKPKGGGTVIVEGSHHVVYKFFSELSPEQLEEKHKFIKMRFYAYDPWLKALTGDDTSEDRRQKFMSDSADVFGYPLRVVELTGEPGEAYITNMSTIHARSMNLLDRPRFMTATPIGQIDKPRQEE